MTGRDAAVGLRRSLEAVWDEIRAEFALQDSFWLAFLFGAEAPEVAELVARSADLARTEVRRVHEVRFGGPDDVAPVLRSLLTPHGPDVAATWVIDAGTGAAEREYAWTELLHRLNERRDRLRAARPAGLLFACPAGMLPLVRDEAPDLWSFRDVATAVDARSGPPSPRTPPAAEADVGPNPLRPTPGPPVRASEAVGPLLRRSANAVRTSRVGAALAAGHEAMDAATTADDVTLAHAWLAQARDLQGKPVEAGQHARAALGAGRPLEEGTTVALLEILGRSPDANTALDAARALVELRRELVRRYPESPVVLRDLSVSIDNVADIHNARGDHTDASRAGKWAARRATGRCSS